MSSDSKTLTVDIQIAEGETLGAILNHLLIITEIRAGTLAEGKLKLGDQIVSVNYIKITDANSFYNALVFAPPCASLTVVRDEKKAEELEDRFHIPADRGKLFERRDGFSYFMAKLIWVRGGPKLGLGIKHYQKRVLISRCDTGSLTAEQMAPGDHMVDIDGKPVTDKDVACALMIKSLTDNGQVTMVMGRPETDEAKQWTNQALESRNGQLPNTILDVLNNVTERLNDRLH